MGATINPDDTIENGTATGLTKNGRDSYAFTGEITDFSGEDNTRVYLNREEIDAEVLGREPQFENTLTIEGNGGGIGYHFAVEGELEENYGLSGVDTIDGNVADGAVGSGQDSYTFSGDISTFRTDGDGSFTTYLNGTEVDPETLGATQTTPDADQLPNEVSIRALTNDRTEYGFGVSGALATGERSNTYSGDNAAYEYARGWVKGEGLDNYKFSGEIRTLTDFETFQIDIDRDEQTIDIEDFDSGGRTDYEITVSGEMTPKQTSSEDSVSGGTATGAIADGTDVYKFTGEMLLLKIIDVIRLEVDFVGRSLENHEFEILREKIKSSRQYDAIRSSLESDDFTVGVLDSLGASFRNMAGEYQTGLGIPVEYSNDENNIGRAAITAVHVGSGRNIVKSVSQVNRDSIKVKTITDNTVEEQVVDGYQPELLDVTVIGTKIDN